jgi:acid phosphatase type 7
MKYTFWTVITGSAGCDERHDAFVLNPPEWSAFRNADYGYTRLTILNNTHLSIEQVSDDQDCYTLWIYNILIFLFY